MIVHVDAARCGAYSMLDIIASVISSVKRHNINVTRIELTNAEILHLESHLKDSLCRVAVVKRPQKSLLLGSVNGIKVYKTKG